MASVKLLGRSPKNNDWRFSYSVSLGRDPITNKQITRSKTESFPATYSEKKARKEADKNAAQFEADVKAGRIQSKQEIKAAAKAKALKEMQEVTVNAYAERYLSRLKSTHSLNTVQSYTPHLKRFRDRYGEYKLKDITRLIMKQFMEDESTSRISKSSGEVIDHSTLKVEYAVLSAFFNSAVEDEIIEISPLYNVKCPRKPKGTPTKESKVYTLQEAQHILKCVENAPPIYKTLITLLLDSGCRIGEALGLKWDAIDMKTGDVIIRLNAQCKKGGMYTTTPKNGQERTITLSKEALTVMKQWKLEQTRERLAKGEPQSEYCFHGRNSEIITTSTVEAFFRVFGQKHGIDRFHPHALRHTMATLMIANGADIASVSHKLGHSDINITLNTYTHHNEEAVDKANKAYSEILYRQA